MTVKLNQNGQEDGAEIAGRGQNRKRASPRVSLMVRELGKGNIKKVIDAVREKPRTWAELERLGIPEKSVTRILTEYLSYWGLVKKDESGRWVWFENIRTFENRHDYDIALEHSKALLNGFPLVTWAIVQPGFLREKPIVPKGEEMMHLKKAVEDHLKTGYPQVYEKIREAIRGKEEARALLVKEIGELPWILTGLDEAHPRLMKLDHVYTYLVTDGVPKRFRSDVRKLAKKIPSEKIDTFREIGSRMTELFLQSASEIRGITLRIENAEPLRGSCELCPRVKVADGGSEESKQNFGRARA